MVREYLSYALISQEEESWGQYSTRDKAIREAKMETVRTGRKHQHFLCTTYRNLIPRVCWAVTLLKKWEGDDLVTDIDSLNVKL